MKKKVSEMFIDLLRQKKAAISLSLICFMILSALVGTHAAWAGTVPGGGGGGVVTTFNGTLDTDHSYIKATMPYPYTTVYTSGFSAGTAATNTRNYYLQPFTPTVSGNYDIELTAASLMGKQPNNLSNNQLYATDDTFLFLYAGSFDPLHPLDHLVAGHDDISGSNKRSKLPGMNLEANKTYSIVLTSYYREATGSLTFTVTGPGELQRFTPSADLNSLTFSQGTLAGPFDSGTTSYTSSVANSVYSVSVTAATYQSASTMQVSVNGAVYAPLTSGIASGDLALNIGANTINVQVTALDGTTVKTYTIIVTRELSDNADLKALALSQGTLSPAFARGTTSYSSSVANSVYSVAVTAAVYNNASTMHVRVNGGAYAPLANGSTSGDLALNVGTNTIDVEATAQNGTTKKVYTIVVVRNGVSSSSSSSSSSSAAPSNNGLDIIVNGKVQDQIATGTATNENGKTVLTATVDAAKLTTRLDQESQRSSIVIPVTQSADKVTVLLTGDAVKAMENKQAVLEVQTGNGNYKLPAAQMVIDRLSAQLGEKVKLSDIVIHVEIAKSDTSKAQIMNNTAAKGHFSVVVPPVEFTVTATFNGKTVAVDQFSSYVTREIPLPSGVDPSKVTTAVVLGEDGSTRHVPSYVKTRDGKSYAVVNSLTNSLYSLIWNSATFADVEGHWSKNAVNDMASRMVINGVDASHFNPDSAINRAEFAAIIVRALGLSDNGKTAAFVDVKSSDWYLGAVAKAQEFKLIDGYEDGTFRPLKTITHEEAMVIIARAMNIAGLETGISQPEADNLLSGFADGATVSGWAKQATAATVKHQLVEGSNIGLQPSSEITRAETAVIVQRMLAKARLINVKP
ncbi:cadherin-like beta sandwich domain-containing protein [Paenibacillus cremeus]|uniref:cadherin-like beta sandwich domain-containing protein n=1 Tax=Paenibacillus cremeus TaxID=2163881 RepID=UPI001647D58E|nr:cadherin-like beta sandwich domain-containing protein [Paenibacillus cremeus]